MHKLITLSEAQMDKVRAIMTDRGIESFSELIRYLVLFYEDNQKRPIGRPKANSSEDDANEEDDVAMYSVPDKFTTAPYTYTELVAWYSAHPEAGEMPARKDLKLHKDYKPKG